MRLYSSFLAICSVIASPVLGGEYNRIASAGGDITEIIYALGAGDKIIGVDSTSGFPDDVRNKEQIGYVRGLSAEGIFAIAPDLLIGADDMGPPNVIDNIKAAGLDVAVAPLGTGAGRVPAKIQFIGKTLGMDNEASQLIKEYTEQMHTLMQKKESLTLSHKVLFILSVRDGAPIVGGRNTSANDIIELAGGTNVVTSFDGWKPMNAEAIIAAAPDLILMTGVHSDRLGGVETVLARPDIAQTPAGKAKNIVTMDAMLMLGFGPRTPIAVGQLLDVFLDMEK